MGTRAKPLILALAFAATACKVAPVPPVAPAVSRAPVNAAWTVSTEAPTVPGTAPTAAPVVPVAAASLVGKVKAPAGILSNNGGSIISDNGGGLVGTNRRTLLAATTQVPVAGAIVALLDADGAPVKGPDGKPLTAITTADGSYGFPAAPRTANLVVRVTVAKGELTAIAPHAGTSPVDLDLVSTYATRYILDTYVATQAQHQATLDRLTPAAEAETRARTEAALLASSAPLPDALTPAAVVQAVASLRKQDAALDQQLEVVRKLLVLAGLDDLGSGRPGTEVPLGFIQLAVGGPDGSLYLTTYVDGRVWRLRPDGVLDTALRYERADAPTFLGLDAAGRLLVATDQRVARLQDGKLETVTTLQAPLLAMVPGPGDGLTLIQRSATPGALDVRTAAGLTLGSVAVPKKHSVLREAARNDAGQLLLRFGAELFRFEAGGLTPITGAPADSAMDNHGNLFSLDSGTLSRWAATGATKLAEDTYGDYAVQAGDQLYVVAFEQGKVYAIRDGRPVHVAGAQGHTSGTAAREFGFVNPNGLAIAPDGTTYITDLGYDVVYRLGLDGKLASIAGLRRCEVGDGCGSDLLPSLPAATSTLHTPRIIRVGPDARPVFVTDRRGLYRQTSDAQLDRVYLAPDGAVVDDFVILPDGSLVVALRLPDHNGCTILHPPDAPLLVTDDTGTFGGDDVTLALGPDGAVFIVGAGKLRRWKLGGTVETLQTKPLADDQDPGPWTFPGATDDLHSWHDARAAVDAHGRLAIARYDGSRIDLVDPTTGATKTVAGPGGPFFASGADALGEAVSPKFNTAGHLVFVDPIRRQVRRIPVDQLPWP
ncbi:MAG: hypothetical protein JWM80_4528 [Cyanobacteria bacterium RYN_339]|nr:hypothetical protein [Cyanobacteria bacterium RYN_339]